VYSTEFNSQQHINIVRTDGHVGSDGHLHERRLA
jgi:hypothetical protein